MTTGIASQARVLIFGQTGQVARALAKIAGPNWVFAGRDQADLSKPETIETVFKSGAWDAVINAAAHTAVDQAESEQELVIAINAAAPALMAKLCAAKNIPFIQISTDYVFDGTKTVPYKEDDAICPVSAYGCSKAQAEKDIIAAGGRPVILRTSWVYAPEGKNFIHTMIRLSEREELKIVADQNGAPTAAADIAGAIKQILNKMLSNSTAATGIFHLSGGGETNWHGFASEIFSYMKERGLKVPASVLAIPTSDYPTPAKRPLNSRMDNSKIEKAYDVKLPLWKDSVRVCLDDIFTALTMKKAV